MRLLLWGALDSGTGFGSVTVDLGRALMDMGVDVRFVAINDVEDAPEGYTVMPLGNPKDWMDAAEAKDPTGNPNVVRAEGAQNWLQHVRGIFRDGYEGWQAEAILVTGDPASIIRSDIPSLLPPGLPAWHYCPIEGVGIPPRWREMWRGMKPIAMCKFGAEQIAGITGETPPFVYHGVDPEQFWPVSHDRPIVLRGNGVELKVLRSKDDCKRLFGADPSRTILLRTDRNMPRKRYGSMLRAVAPVLAAHSDTDLWMHCRTVDEGGSLDDFRSHIRPDIAARMMVTGYHDRGAVIGRDVLNALYNAADVYLSTSAEGFGLTIAEALSCGVPVVAMDFTSVPEVVGDAGVLVPPGYLVENIYAYQWANVHEPKFTEAVEFLVSHKARRLELGRLGPKRTASLTWADAAHGFMDIIDVKEAVAA